MIQPIIRQAMTAFAIMGLALATQAQSVNTPNAVKEIEKNGKPYRILTSGKQVTVKSTKDIRSIMVWTSKGHRILEQKNINTASYNFRISVTEKFFFVMLQLQDGKTYSEKIGVD